jgi:hypothetical protein
MIELLVAFFSSVLFAVGLVVSGMTNPHKVLGFLDITGHWDPSLAFVMMGAIATNSLFFKFILKRKNPIIAKSFSFPNLVIVDRKLIVGSVLFGIGWGLTGICPGPGIVNIISGHQKIFIYLGGMSLGMILFEGLNFLYGWSVKNYCRECN